ncbi:hypothetical protein OHB24_33910 [Kribbella sp. NBC_00482]|uniref:hypothetical protein n=1 Tax=Kribbella sp. NBC_00482 TaxID=2975968 RepID=UPI002E170484
MVQRSTLASAVGFFDGVAVAVAAAGSVDSTGLDEVGAVGVELVVLCWSEGLLPSDALAEPHAAVVSSAATAPAPRAYLLQLPARLRFTFTEDPLFS